jgi:hypothetical protein
MASRAVCRTNVTQWRLWRGARLLAGLGRNGLGPAGRPRRHRGGPCLSRPVDEGPELWRGPTDRRGSPFPTPGPPREEGAAAAVPGRCAGGDHREVPGEEHRATARNEDAAPSAEPSEHEKGERQSTQAQGQQDPAQPTLGRLRVGLGGLGHVYPAPSGRRVAVVLAGRRPPPHRPASELRCWSRHELDHLDSRAV